MTKLEIAIPTWNRAEALDELLSELLPAIANLPISVSVSDNGSIDDTARILEKHRRHEKLRVVRHASNLGFDRNVASLIESRAGEYMWLQGDDDHIAVEHLPVLIRRLECSPDALWTNVTTTVGPSISELRGWSAETTIDFDALVRRYGLIGSCGGLAHFVCRSSLLGAAGSHLEFAGSNYLHVFNLARCLAGRRIELVHEPVTKIRQRTASETETYVDRWEMTNAGAWDFSVMRQAELFDRWIRSSSGSALEPGCFRMYDGMQYPFQLLCLKALANILLSSGHIPMSVREAVRSLMERVPNERFRMLEAAADSLRGQSRDAEHVKIWWRQYREAGHSDWTRRDDGA